MDARKSGFTQTYTGLKFYPVEARPEDLRIEDIAHALAIVNRYNGHTPKPYSVAQHSVIVSLEVAPENALWGLLHDASEAYIGDMVSPLKRMMVAYQVVESELMKVVCKKFALPEEMPEDVKRADLAVLAAEYRDMFVNKPFDWGLPIPAVKRKIKPVGWRKAQAMFLQRFQELWTPHSIAVGLQHKVDT
jgi:hypothetical protein